MKPRISLEAQALIIATILIVAVSIMIASFHYWLNNIYLAALFSSAIIIPSTVWVVKHYLTPITRILQALNDGFQNFIDNDFSVSIAKTRNDELGDLVETYNRVSETLRNERVYIYQRELLLDTVIQSTPLSLVLVDDTSTIIYSNSAARLLFHEGRAINGLTFPTLLTKMPAPFIQSIDSGLNGLFTVEQDDKSETYHLTQNKFLLNGRAHNLYLFKVLTKEISRQEVNTWKKVIRLISHELNNSLAPISSLAHSGQILSKKENSAKLEKIFVTVEERARYLQQFIEGYAKFARLPKPQKSLIVVSEYFENLKKIRQFNLNILGTEKDFFADPSQLQQVIINLVKNAYESGSDLDEIELVVSNGPDICEISVKDRGKGMSDKNLTNALLPFYSTKASGTGLGLPLCKEIVEAHGGKLLITNRKKGGLSVSILLPMIKG